MSSQLYPWVVAVIAVLVVVSTGCTALNQPTAPLAPETDPEAAALLIRLQSDITRALEAMDSRLAYAAFDLGKTGLNDTAARGTLANLSVADPSIADCVAVDGGGTIVAAEPAAYHGTEGADIQGQDHVRHILATKRPVMSEVIMVAEGFQAGVIAAPVFTNESRFAGFAAVVFRPYDLIAGVAGPATNGTSCQVMVIQTDGRVLYDTDPTQVGRLTFEDPLYADYPDLLDVAHRVADERYGTATYGFAADGGEAVQKKITWTTTGLHGTEWRVAVIGEV
ncbi:MAG: cache domain-containing protein [Methanoculleus sp.]|nr:cache domain-containing protein [Methanoculleus sp.]